MPALIVMTGVFFIIAMVFFSNAKSSSQAAAMTSNGVLGRGLILQASQNVVGTSTVNGQRCEQRTVVLDVEVPGQSPYEVSFIADVPRLVEALPGATVDVRVDPQNPTNVTIVGPAGSSAWLPVAMPFVAANTPGMPMMTANTGPAGNIVGGVIFMFFALMCGAGVVAMAVTPDEKVPFGGYCDAAARCCKAANLTKCTKYQSMTSKSCESAYKSLKQQSSKQHYKCE